MSNSQKSLDVADQIYERAYAKSLDDNDPLKQLRNEFIIPCKDDLSRKTLAKSGTSHSLELVAANK